MSGLFTVGFRYDLFLVKFDLFSNLRFNACFHVPRLCSLIGVTIISFGFYTVMWGKAKEQNIEEAGENRPVSIPSEKVPLLQNHKVDEV